MISENDFDRLVEKGLRKGSLAIDDIKQEMPVETMTSEDLAGLVILLEEHGITIDLDPELLRPTNAATAILARRPAVAVSAEAPPIAPLDSYRGVAPAAARAVSHDLDVTPEGSKSGFSVDRFVYAMAIGLVLFLLGWAAWGYLLR